MTTIGDIAQASLHLVRIGDDLQVGRPILSVPGLSVPGIRKLSEEEAAPFRKDWEDRVQLSAQAQAEQAERMRASEEQHQKDVQIKMMMDQLHREVTRIAKSMPEDTVFASFTDGKGKVTGKLYQSGAVWFDSNEGARVGGAGAIQKISEQAWAQTKDAKQARQIMFDQFNTLLAGSSQTKLTLTGLPENPQPAFKADAPLLAIMDKISAIDPDFGSRFDEWRPDSAGPQNGLSLDAAPSKPGTLPEGGSGILTLSVDIEVLKEKANKTLALLERQEALFKMREDRALNDPTADTASFFAQIRAKMDKVIEAGKRLLKAMDDVPPYAVIRDRQGKEVGRIFQDGGFVTTDPRFQGLHLLVADGQRSIIDGKHERYEAIRKALGSTGRIELTGVDVDPQMLFPDLRKAVQTARDELDALREDRQKRLDAYHATQAAIRDLWA